VTASDAVFPVRGKHRLPQHGVPGALRLGWLRPFRFEQVTETLRVTFVEKPGEAVAKDVVNDYGGQEF
jgi:hypothetical protein